MRLLIIGLVFSMVLSGAKLLVFGAPAELVRGISQGGIYGDGDVLGACVYFSQPGERYLITFDRGEKVLESFGRADEDGQYCKVYSFDVSERGTVTIVTAQQIELVGEVIHPIGLGDYQ